MRSDFKKLGKYDLVGRALKQLVSDGKLMKIAHGMYAKSRTNQITGGPMLSAHGGFFQVSKEALELLGVDFKMITQNSKHIVVNAVAVIPRRQKVRRIATHKFELRVVHE